MNNFKSARFGRQEWQPRVIQGGNSDSQGDPNARQAHKLPDWLRMTPQQIQQEEQRAEELLERANEKMPAKLERVEKTEKTAKPRKHLRLVTAHKTAPESRSASSGTKPRVTRLVSKPKRTVRAATGTSRVKKAA